MIEIEIPGKPIPLARPRFNKKTGCVYDSQRVIKKPIQDYIAMHRPLTPLECPIELYIEFLFLPPKGKKIKEFTEIYHIKKPDGSNLLKFYEDCMNNIIFKDDSQIFKATFIKKYDVVEKTRIRLKEMVEHDS